MGQNIHKACKLLKNLTNYSTTVPLGHYEVTSDQIANQVLINGKTKRRHESRKLQRYAEEDETTFALPSP
uniref:(California timema) hypothetical protein n=1 Tax=Timema californicum TaxID=61474 RepID=A0A7R9PE07_TIMCA|nr:unnamed protein product [Timema californicum]